MNDKDAIQHLQQSDRYRVIERLHAPERYWQGEPKTARIGIVIDTETTGLDTASNKIIELGFIAFEYDAASGLIYRILHTYDGFEDPHEPLSDIVKQITGISDDMLTNQQLDDDAIHHWFKKADLMIAHNANFDRPVLERRLPLVKQTNWACSFHDIPWQDEDISSLKLDYIAYKLGFFFDGHRAVNDAQATLHILSKALPNSGKLAMATLLAGARKKTQRLFAIRAPFDKKDDLKARDYRWLADFTHQGKKGVWSKSINEADIETEQQWLKDTVYAGKPAPFIAKDISPKDRYSVREYTI